MINPGIKAALNPIAFQAGPFTIHWYGVIIASGVVLALLLAVRGGKREGISEDDFYDYLLWALPIAIICARIYYVVFSGAIILSIQVRLLLSGMVELRYMERF